MIKRKIDFKLIFNYNIIEIDMPNNILDCEHKSTFLNLMENLIADYQFQSATDYNMTLVTEKAYQILLSTIKDQTNERS